MTLEDAKDLIDMVTQETETKSIDKYVDASYLAKKGDVNKGIIKPATLMRECEKNYHDNVERYRHGKITFKAMKNELQNKKLAIKKLISSSEYIIDEGLKEFRENAKIEESE